FGPLPTLTRGRFVQNRRTESMNLPPSSGEPLREHLKVISSPLSASLASQKNATRPLNLVSVSSIAMHRLCFFSAGGRALVIAVKASWTATYETPPVSSEARRQEKPDAQSIAA